jgi:ribose 5-phosphate isomerase B
VRLVLGADDDSPIVARVDTILKARGHEVVRLAVAPWGKVGREVGLAVASGKFDQGVVLCFTGTGVSLAANKVPGVRAALSVDAATAAGARRWNDANVLALSLRLLTDTLATEILDAWLATEYEGGEDESLAVIETPGPSA